MKLEKMFRRIHANSANLFHGRSPLFEICNDLILAQSMPSGGRGRDDHYWSPPAQIPACGATAPGSYLGCVTRNRCSGHGWRMRGYGR